MPEEKRFSYVKIENVLESEDEREFLESKIGNVHNINEIDITANHAHNFSTDEEVKMQICQSFDLNKPAFDAVKKQVISSKLSSDKNPLLAFDDEHVIKGHLLLSAGSSGSDESLDVDENIGGVGQVQHHVAH